jgi:predicted RNA methylase
VIRGLPFVLVVGKATERSARDTVSAWTAGSGTASVVAAMEAHSWTSCDDLTVTAADFDVVTIAGVDYLAAMFEADAIGPGGV